MLENILTIYHINIKKNLRKLNPMQVNLISDYGIKIHAIERENPEINKLFISINIIIRFI
jgi:hypothetical protein